MQAWLCFTPQLIVTPLCVTQPACDWTDGVCVCACVQVSNSYRSDSRHNYERAANVSFYNEFDFGGFIIALVSMNKEH